METDTVLVFKDVRTVPDIIHEYTESIRNDHTPIVIDNGSYQSRVGWATSDQPLLVFKNLIAKPRKERSKKDAEPPVTPPIQIGNNIFNIEAVRFQLKTQFDKNVITHFEAQEQILDYTFTHLGINTQGCVDHPIVMTEAFVTPNYCRHLMSELLFECYNIPAVCYGVDSLFSLYRNKIGDTALIINCGYHTIHVIPVIRGQVISEHARRINLGGSEMTTYLHKLLQLKYPVHVNSLTLSRAEELLHTKCSIALDYQETIKRWADPDYYEENVIKIQLPFAQPQTSTALSVEAQKERRKEMAKRLIEINARKREEKLAEDEEQYNILISIQELYDEGDDEEFVQALRQNDIKGYSELQSLITTLMSRIEKNRQKIVSAATGEETFEPKPVKGQAPTDPIAFHEWLQEIREKYRSLVARKTAKRSTGRRTAAGVLRQRTIAHLATDEADDDWDAYRTISRDDSDSEGESEAQLLQLLREHEPRPETALHHQLHLAIEPIRAPELMFQPSMLGSIEAGLAETMEHVFKKFSAEDQLLLANNVFLTGGCAKFPGLKERLERELLEMRPFQTTHKVVTSQNASLDAWYGARDYCSDPDFEDSCVTKEEYFDMGGEYLKEHKASNKYFRSPEPIEPELSQISVAAIKEEIIVDC